MKYHLILAMLFLFTGCKNETKKEVSAVKPKKEETVKKVKVISQEDKYKVGKNTYKEALERTKNFAYELNFDLDYIRNKGLADKKFLAEYLGLFLKLQKAAKTKKEKAEIRDKVKGLYEKTLDPKFHNMALVDDKLFKKNSMSYMRIMWLLNELGFDISLHRKELAKVQFRMDDHMKVRGEWQRAVFDKYYDYFNIEKPLRIKYAKKLKGPIGYQRPLDYYKRTEAYILTHFVFAAYDYGNKTTQDRFTKQDIDYLAEILPQIITKFEAKNNDDLVGELLTCLVMIGETNTPSFKNSYNRLLSRQNNDGSFGSYERTRSKIGNDVEFRQYLHTTLVCIEMFIEDDLRK